MAFVTNVPAPVFGPTGFIAPADSVVLAGVQADQNAAFNGNLNPGLTTPQGQLATSDTAIISNSNDAFCYITNQMDPAFSQGRFQDGIARIYFITRFPSQPTVVTCACIGLPGTVIPAGARAVDGAGNIYTCTDGGVIGTGGTVSLTFANNVPGPTPCPEGTLSQIYQAIPGWDTITNPADGVLGRNTETRAEFETRREESVAKNARGTIQAIQGQVLAVNNVLDAFSYQNDTASPVTYRGVTIGANSVYVAAVGGADADVAQAIWSKKAPGAPYYAGNTTVVVYDTNSGYGDPLPSYNVIFERPAALAVAFNVMIANGPTVPSDAVAQIQAAIIAAFAGVDGGARARIGSTIYASRFIAPVAVLGSWAQIVSLQIGSTNTPAASFTAAISSAIMTVSAVASGAIAPAQSIFGNGVVEGTEIVNQLTGVTSASVTGSIAGTTMTVSAILSGVLAADQVLHDASVIGGTTIIQQLSGSSGSTGTYQVSVPQTVSSTTIAADSPGTTGTYTVSVSQTVSSEAFTSIYVNQNSVVVNIDQVPVTSASDIDVGLV